MITIDRTPNNVNPAGNANIWKVSSDNPDISFFRCKVISGGEVISQFDLYVTPDTLNAAYANVSRILQDLVTWEIPDRNNFLSHLIKPITTYHLEISEQLFSNNQLTEGESKGSGDFTIWDAKIFGSEDYTGGKFLTDKPNYTVLGRFDYEMLYFLADTDFKYKVKLYDKGKNLVDSYISPVQVVTGTQMYRLNISPASLQDQGLYIPNTEYFTVEVTDSADVSVSGMRTYLLDETMCNRVLVNLLWTNDFGGIDSYQFINPIPTVNVDRSTVRRNDYRIDGEGEYTNLNNGIYNAKNEVINTDVKVDYELHSKPIGDNEAVWLRSLYTSKNVWIELANSKLFPVQVTNSSYKINKQRYLGNTANIITVEIEMLLADITAEATKGVEYISLINTNGDLIINDNKDIVLT